MSAAGAGGAPAIEVLELSELKDPRAARALEVLEAGGLVHLPRLPFKLEPEETELLNPEILEARSKNVSFDVASGTVGGARSSPGTSARLARMMRRYQDLAFGILSHLAPAYGPAAETQRTSFRPGPIESRALSPRKDDRRLHIDAFPSSPVQGRRILRVFTNVHPGGEDRRWRIDTSGFEPLARRYAARIRLRRAGGMNARLQSALGLTRGLRTPYDGAMLQLHDLAKADEVYQSQARGLDLVFAPGASWVVFTDATPHAALSGQHAFEQTYLLPVAAMASPERSPLRTLERLFARPLV